ncbi:hypothetical protein B0H13DRAFT_2449389 [Mycena leptocephala]|nr:hypothetical protein B0H13DRAFT_2449389 [Mycena leptocephala]
MSASLSCALECFPKLLLVYLQAPQLRIQVPGIPHSFGVEIIESIKFRMYDVLKLDPIDWSAQFKSIIIRHFKDQIISTPGSPNATLPSAPFHALTRTYIDPGYGTLDLCLVSSDGELRSEACRELIAEIPTRLPHAPDPLIPTFLARWKGHRVTHIAFAHFAHNIFNVSRLFSIPTHNASDTPYWVVPEPNLNIVAEFSFDETPGVGIRGLWEADDGVESPVGGGVPDRAQVWFVKN